MNPPTIRTIILCVLFCGQALAQAQEMDKELSGLASRLATLTKDKGKKKVAVLDFTDLQGGSSELGKYIAEELTVDLVMVGKEFSVLDRANLKRILAEHKLTATGLVNPENSKILGQFAGVDALILGSIVPMGDKIALKARIITTDTAVIVGADKAEFKKDETVKQLFSQPASAENAADGVQTSSSTPPTITKPFGDLQAKVESLQVITPNSPGYLIGRLTLTISNTSASRTFGVALEPDFYNKFNLVNSRGDEFRATEVTGINTAFDHNDGVFQGSMTDIPPKSSITIVSKSQLVNSGSLGDYRPYRLQTVVIWGMEEKGRHPDLRKYNLVLDIK